MAIQWKDAGKVINCLKSINEKIKIAFMRFGIRESYSSISKDFLMNKIDYTEQFVEISKEEIRTIIHSRKYRHSAGLILATYCMQYPHAMSFLWNKMPYSLLKAP